MKISDACKLTGISKRTIHFYIHEKLIFPKSDPENGYYIFEQEDVDRLIFCRDLRNAGVSIPEIRSLLGNPLTAGHYLNLHIHKLKMQQENLQKVIDSVQYILTNLPISPDLNDLYELEKSANIPEPYDNSDSSPYDVYTISLLNRFLWGLFLPSKHLNDYQEYLWNKLNRMVLEERNEDYITLLQFVKMIDNSSIEKMYTRINSRREYVISLDETGCNECAHNMITVLKQRINDTSLHHTWKRFYTIYFAPETRIFASKYSEIMCELSPQFASYSKNIKCCLKIVYEYLCSEEGQPLYDELMTCFDGYLDIENSNHGELESLVNLPDLAMILK